MSGTRPVVALDVDGVVSPYDPVLARSWKAPPPGWINTGGLAVMVSEVVLEAMVALERYADAGLVEVLWCTTWTYQAPQHFGPWFGSRWPWLDLRGRPDHVWHKASALAEHMSDGPRRSLLWFDDDLGRYLGDVARVADVRDLTAVAPPPAAGLASRHLARLSGLLAGVDRAVAA